MLKLNAVFNTVWGRLVFFVFISLHINRSHICMVKVLAVIYNPKPDNEHPHCLFIWEIPEKTLFFPDLIYTHHHHHHSAPSGPTGRDALNNYLISRTTGPTPRSQDPPFQFRNPLLEPHVGVRSFLAFFRKSHYHQVPPSLSQGFAAIQK